MYEYSIYDVATGRIKTSGQCSRQMDVAGQSIDIGCALLEEQHDQAEIYIVAGVATPRSKLCPQTEISIAADGSDNFTIANVPVATRFFVNGQWHDVDDGQIVFTTMVAGRFDLIVDPPFPHQFQTVTVTANAV